MYLNIHGHGRRQRGGAGRGHGPSGFSHTFYLTSQISKVLLFVVVNTESLLIAPSEKFSADDLVHGSQNFTHLIFSINLSRFKKG